jgi:hypothetical protein
VALGTGEGGSPHRKCNWRDQKDRGWCILRHPELLENLQLLENLKWEFQLKSVLAGNSPAGRSQVQRRFVCSNL